MFSGFGLCWNLAKLWNTWDKEDLVIVKLSIADDSTSSPAFMKS